jgi:hypothetical protein
MKNFKIFILNLAILQSSLSFAFGDVITNHKNKPGAVSSVLSFLGLHSNYGQSLISDSENQRSISSETITTIEYSGFIQSISGDMDFEVLPIAGNNIH